MNQVIEFAQALWPYVFLVAGIIVYAYQWAQAHNKHLAEKMEGLYEIAKNLEAQEAVLDKSNDEKKLSATSNLVKAANAYNIKVSHEAAAGMIERAHNEAKVTENGDEGSEIPTQVGFLANDKEVNDATED
ncbi:phage holin, LLH family [Lactobacillus sp. LL6]|uniref:phage holin, LLH family n=1 Tax=Lactobacillus sp. LL6 TaxID=2596827 RepID=UPI001186A01D|nr:phage holin, LLH family [Lactobacillus sp. LL6]TSO25277.1 hypothetical protein FOD82_08540 [Lactobacillus sp. LL6]